MEVRPYKVEDYEELFKWWSKHNWTPLSPDLLPETGYIVEGYACCFLYKTDSKICWMGWPISNPETDKELRSQALDLIIKELKQKAVDLDYKIIITTTNLEYLGDRYEKHNFVEGDKNITQYILGVK